jgi:hypothetical protein
MEAKTIIIAMASCGVISAVSEKILNSFGKSDMASFTNIAGLAGVGISGLGLVMKLIQMLAKI